MIQKKSQEVLAKIIAFIEFSICKSMPIASMMVSWIIWYIKIWQSTKDQKNGMYATCHARDNVNNYNDLLSHIMKTNLTKCKDKRKKEFM